MLKQELQTLIDQATLEEAQAYAETDEKFTHCLDLLELSLTLNGDTFCSVWVERLERKYEDLLAG